MSSLYSLLEFFLDYLYYQKRYAKNTADGYKSDIESFILFIEREYACKEAKEISASMARNWLAGFTKDDYAPKSILRKKSALRRFMKFLLKENVIEIDPTRYLPSIKTGKRIPTYATEKEMRRLFDHVHFSDDYVGALEYLVLSLLYFTGMRVSELVNCKNGDADISNKYIKVMGKGGKERIIPLADHTLAQITRYMREKEAAFQGAADYTQLLLSEKGVPLTRQRAYSICKKYLSMVTTLNKKSPHVFRHTFATHLLKKNAPIHAIKDLLGHANLSATQIYTHADIGKLKQVYKNAHPHHKKKNK